MGVLSTYVKRFLGRVFFGDGVEIDGDLSLSGTMTSGSVPADRVNSGTLDVLRSWAYTGDVTSSAGFGTLTIGNDAVTNAKLSNMVQGTFKMRAAGAGTGDPIDGTAAQAKTALAISTADVSGLAAIASSGSASDLSAGTVATARLGSGTASDRTLYVGNQTHASIVDYLRYNAYWFTDFLSGANAIPEMTYTTGSGATAASAAPAGGVGALSFSLDGVTAGSFGAALSAAAFRFSLYGIRVTMRVQVSQLQTSADHYAFRVGFLDATAAKPTDGAYIEYDTSASANWRYCTANNSVRTETASGTAVTAGAWHLLAIEVNAAGTSAEFFLNGASLGTITTNIPTGAARTTMFGFHVVRLAGTPSQLYTGYCDLIGLDVDLNPAR
jgi:hypothetical protein